jgi:hypothetical protein
MLSRLTDLGGLRCSRALKISESEIGDTDRNSEDYEREGKTPGVELLYTN